MLLLSEIKVIEAEVEKYFQLILDAALHFQEAIGEFHKGVDENFSQRLNKINQLEEKADELRRSIRYQLYTEMLIPDARGDVLGLLETSDSIIDQMKEVIIDLDIEKPIFPSEWSDDFGLLAKYTLLTVESFKSAVNRFFHGDTNIADSINKVYFYESEVDTVERSLKRRVFQDTAIQELGEKIQLKTFIERIADVSDLVEDVAERLSVYSIKRTI